MNATTLVLVGVAAGLAYLVFFRAPTEPKQPPPGSSGFQLGFQLGLPSNLFDD